ncbi:cytochrome c biogenesis protein CcsA [Pseudogemmatithrix spongiicola]|uniref:Heme exporter protein C n=1 Tax=Pseudogemmatithrix spongiicola TaxID=3062599 RepID=A0AA49JW14_9BACT|nr:cytochrome c biogenesis protein CcsA [Gemmatimonadaceae bacterium 'strain 138']WKW15993.1 cytochrome c biogenesis protein CcsA [Gemmatimonadaceae bacterium 'strain 318']
MTAPASVRPRRGIDWLMVAAVALMTAAFVRAIYFTPPDRLQGMAQKIFYVHLPSAWVAFLAFGLTAIAGGVWLFIKDPRLDRFAESSAEVGVIFTTGVLVSGPLWGKPIWGAWWVWDARLTLTLFLWFLYLGYLVLRGAVDDRQARARYSAVVGILGALLIPFIHLSVYLFRTQHPTPIVANPTGIQMPAVMITTLFLALGAFTVLYMALVRQRMALAAERDALLDATTAES